MPTILAARNETPADRAAVPAASIGGQDRVISLVVVRDGVTETFVLESPARDAVTTAPEAATRLGSGIRTVGPAPVNSLPAPEPLDLVGASAVSDEPGDSLLAEIASLLPDTSSSTTGQPPPFDDDLTTAEARVLRYLPTNLTAWEIAEELYVSLNTVKTHMRHIYAKLAVHRRREAVERARAFGLLAPSSSLRPGRQAAG